MNVSFRWHKKNQFSIAALAPLLGKTSLVKEPRDGIMIYSFASPQTSQVYEEISTSKTRSIYIAGGPHPSARPEEALKYFDYVVVGEGEETLPELVLALKSNSDVSRVKGIVFKDPSGSLIFTEKRKPVELDNYPPFAPGLVYAPIEISRGCPFSCAYCQTPSLFGQEMRHRSISVIEKYALYYEDLRFISPNAFAYGSDGITPRPDKVKSLLESLARPGKKIYFGTFPCEVRPEFISKEMLELVTKHCANTTLSLGAQSGSPRVLKEIKRDHTVQDIIEGVELCFEYGLIPKVDFIFGLPCEKHDNQLQNLKLIEWICSKGGLVHAHHFFPLPGSIYEHENPSPISKEVKLVLGRLALKGKASGVWQPSHGNSKMLRTRRVRQQPQRSRGC